MLIWWAYCADIILVPALLRRSAQNNHAANTTHIEAATEKRRQNQATIHSAEIGVQSFFARAVDSPMACYANADIVRKEQDQLPLQFIEYWKDITGVKPDWLYFDSKLTTYAVLDQLRQDAIDFITIRR
ncbi:MAG: hypothetical protein MUO77_01850, partial [Anaerolineales bacterium]|nr:hypothetical protein [Anaerolineales bacterium]